MVPKHDPSPQREMVSEGEDLYAHAGESIMKVVWRLPNGTIHRVDGPAIEYDSGGSSWYWNGERLDKEEFDRVLVRHQLEKP
jgi:hypothetical protein